ncbi:MAG: transporter substrate-binding domain-containing protein [Coriobacteriia bacterium]|nr:transporter substrate-binding domain-containing protein [Coriobacteriia bacterium]
MKKVRFAMLAAAAALLVFGAFALVACAGSSSAPGGNTLKVAVREGLTKFSTYNESANTFYGFEDDLAKELAAQLGYADVEFVGVVANEREKALDDGKADCLIAAFSETPDRASKYDLSEPYYYDNGRVMVATSTLFESFADLQGCRVGTLRGTDVSEVLASTLARKGLIPSTSATSLAQFLTLVTFESYADMYQAVQNGRVDALCADGCITLPWIGSEMKYLDEPYSEENYVVATPKGSALSEKVNQAVQTLKENGTVQRLMEKWDI